MDLKKLKKYENWVGESPTTILQAAASQGGWSRVFPWGERFPVWASRVRNYFNVTPSRLKLLDEGLAKALIGRTANPVYSSLGRDPKAAVALSGDVYVDEKRNLWFEMRAGGAVYHYGGMSPGVVKAGKATLLTQSHVPVFKLVSPDRTGGSREVCIHNWQLYRGVGDVLDPRNYLSLATSGKKRISKVDQWKNVRTKVVIEQKYQGSYNYSETIKKGSDNHDLRDVKPHSGRSGFYVDPPRFSDLAARRFPATDRAGKELAAMGP